MRRLILLLVALNLVALAWWQGWLDTLTGGAREPARMAMQIEPDRVRVAAARDALAAPPAREDVRLDSKPARQPGVAAPARVAVGDSPATARTPERARPGAVALPGAESRPGSAAHSTGAPGPAAGPAPAARVESRVDDVKPDTPGGQASVTAQPVLGCVQFSPIEQARVAELSAALEAGGVRAERGRVENTSGYVVYIEPFPTLRDAQRRVQELRGLGVPERDIYLLPDGPYRQGIALGVFRSEESARVQLRRLEARGVDGAQIGFVNPAATRVYLRARGPIDRLADISAREAAKAGLTVAPCE